ncbi:MAG: alkaline shock response membrane anchor protein AmaP [Clostridiales bacterium]|nr:alkaline shock response membrane anchor protein AmaP [Clostridiales bacterium]
MSKLRGLIKVVNIIFIVILSLTLLYLFIDVKAFSTLVLKITSVGIFSTIRIVPVIFWILMIFLNIVLVLNFAKRDKSKGAIQFTNETGIVSISAQSIESLAKLEAKLMDEVSDIRTQIFSSDNNADLEVFAKVPPTVSIPEVSLRLQNNIKRKIQDTTGVELKSIKIIIDGILDPVN